MEPKEHKEVSPDSMHSREIESTVKQPKKFENIDSKQGHHHMHIADMCACCARYRCTCCQFLSKKFSVAIASYEVIYWLIRYFFVSMSFCLALVTFGYGIANLITVEGINFFCDPHTAEEVYQHNLEIGSNTGISNATSSCWRINRLSFDDNSVYGWDNIIYDAYWSISDQSLINLFAFGIYLMLTLYLVKIGIENLFGVICDTAYFYCLHRSNPRIRKVQQYYKNKSKNINDDKNKVKFSYCGSVAQN